jgi:hypothetical protein
MPSKTESLGTLHLRVVPRIYIPYIITWSLNGKFKNKAFNNAHFVFSVLMLVQVSSSRKYACTAVRKYKLYLYELNTPLKKQDVWEENV